MRAQLIIFAVVVALLPACTLDEVREYRIAPARTSDASKVQLILRDVAKQAGLPPSRPRPSPQIAAHEGSNVFLRAFTWSDEIKVYLSRSDWPPPRAYIAADRLLAPALSTAFGHRFGVPKDDGVRVIVY